MSLLKSLVLVTTALFFSSAFADDVLTQIQTQWATCQYQTPEKEKEVCFSKLNTAATAELSKQPQRDDLKVWLAIVKSTYAGAKGGLGALSLCEEAKALLEQVIASNNPQILDGSAYTSLGSLYYQVPGWPLGFGDDQKAKELLQKALQINPNGIDPNYFYGDFLLEEGNSAQAKIYFEKALQAPARPGRESADTGRRAEIKTKLKDI